MKLNDYHRWVVLLLLCLCTALGRASAAYHMSPLVNNYSSSSYQAGAQNWAVCEDSIGNLYFGNSEGLLQFNGEQWQLYPFNNSNQVIRSLYFDKESGRIYAGGFEEFGYYVADGYGGLTYCSLKPRLDASNYLFSNDEVWNIVRKGGAIYFQSFSSYFVYESNQLRAVKQGEQYHFFFEMAGELYCDLTSHSLSKLGSDGEFVPVEVKFPSTVINGFRIAEGVTLWITESHGVWRQEGDKLSRVDNFATKWPQANRAYLTSDSLLAIGTHRDGLLMLDLTGRLCWNIHSQNGLRNNTVLNIGENRSGDLWIALDKGISRLHRSSPLTLFQPSHVEFGSVYTAATFNDRLYLGTNQGVFEAKISGQLPLSVLPVSGQAGLVWSIVKIDDQAFVLGNGSTSEIIEGKLRPVNQTKGATCMVRAQLGGEEVLLQGSYSDLSIYRRSSDGKWKLSHLIQGFMQPVSSIQVDGAGVIWAGHFHKGLFRIELNDTFTRVKSSRFYTSLDGKESTQIAVYLFGNQIVFTDQKQIYTTNGEGEVVAYDELNTQLGQFRTSFRIVEVSPTRYWFIRDQVAALFHLYDGILQEVDAFDYAIFNEDLLREQKSIFPLGADDYLVGLDNRFALYQARKALLRPREPLLIVNQLLQFDKSGNSVRLELDPALQLNLMHKQNHLQIHVSSPGIAANKQYKVYYRLCGRDDEFVESAAGWVIDFVDIPAGNYTFEAMLWYDGKLLQQTLCSYQFTVSPKFWASRTAYLIYGVLLLALLACCTTLFIRLVRGSQLSESEEE